jgi:hypothetical protein
MSGRDAAFGGSNQERSEETEKMMNSHVGLPNSLTIPLAVAALSITLVLGATSPPAADEPGTIGIGLGQLYSDSQPNNRGPLVVLQVSDGLPGSKAGIKKGDIVIALNGTEVAGRELADLLRKEIRGPVGGPVRLKLTTPEGNETEITLIRVPYPPHNSQATDPFAYRIPGSWRAESRYSFPLPWSPKLAYHGSEDLAFAPDFNDTASPEYHSYLFFWWLDGANEFTSERLQSDMIFYFQGLSSERGKDSKFTPDLAKVSAKYEADAGGPAKFGGEAAKSFRGAVSIYDSHGKIITLQSEVVTCFCPATRHTAAFFGMSLEPAAKDIWKQLHAIRDSFRCER